MIRFGVLGCASIALRRMLPALEAAEGVELTAVASRDPAKAREKGCDATDSYDSLLRRPDVDAVYIPLPTGLHAEWVSRALAAGKHVLSEKPLTVDLDTAERLVAEAAQAGLLLMENLMFLHHAQHRTVRKLVADGRIGEPRVFSASFGIPPRTDDDIRYRPDLGGGALLDVGVYPIRAAQLILGQELEVVGATRKRDRDVDVSGHALLRTEKSTTAELSWGFEHAYRSGYAIWGDRGRLTLDRAFTPAPDWQPVVRIETQDRVEELTLPADDQFRNSAEAFARAVRQRADAGEAILRQARLVDEIRRRAA